MSLTVAVIALLVLVTMGIGLVTSLHDNPLAGTGRVVNHGPAECPAFLKGRYAHLTACEGYDDSWQECNYEILNAGQPLPEWCAGLPEVGAGVANERLGEEIPCRTLGFPREFRCWQRRSETPEERGYRFEAVNPECTAAVSIGTCQGPHESDLSACLQHFAISQSAVGKNGLLTGFTDPGEWGVCRLAQVSFQGETVNVPTYRLDLAVGETVRIEFAAPERDDSRQFTGVSARSRAPRLLRPDES